MSQTNTDLMKHSQHLEQEQLIMKEKVLELKHKIEEMLKLMPASVRENIERRTANIVTSEDGEGGGENGE